MRDPISFNNSFRITIKDQLKMIINVLIGMKEFRMNNRMMMMMIINLISLDILDKWMIIKNNLKLKKHKSII